MGQSSEAEEDDAPRHFGCGMGKMHVAVKAPPVAPF